MPVDPQNTQIKETAAALARRFGWNFHYEGGLELGGEFLDDADLQLERLEDGVPVEYVLNLSYADSTAYGYTLTREASAAPTLENQGSSFGLGTPSRISAPSSFSSSGLPGEQAVTLAEKYYMTSIQDLTEELEQKLALLAA